MRGISLSFGFLTDPVLSMDDRVYFRDKHQLNSKSLVSGFENMILHPGTFAFNRPVLDPDSKGLFSLLVRISSGLSQASAADLLKILKLASRFIRDGKMGKIKVLNRPIRFLMFCFPAKTRSEKSKLVSIRFLLLTVNMAGIIPPFRFELRMRKMILGKREDSPGKRPLELLTKKRRSKKSERQENYRTTGHCDPKANQSHPPSPHFSPESRNS